MPRCLFRLSGSVTQVALLPFGRFNPNYWVLRGQLGPVSYLFPSFIEENTYRDPKIFFLRFCMTARLPIMAKDSRLGTEHSAAATRAVGVSIPPLIT